MLGTHVQPFEISDLQKAASSKRLGLATPFREFSGAFLTGEGAPGSAIIDFYSVPDRTTGHAFGEMNHVGMPRIGVFVRDLAGLHRSASLAGYAFLSEPVGLVLPGAGEVSYAVCRGPEGICVALIERRGSGPSGPAMMQGVFDINVNCSSLERSLAFYRDVLGMSVTERFELDGQAELGRALALGPAVAGRGCLLEGARHSAGATCLSLIEWARPAPIGTHYVGSDAFFHVGIVRVALEVDDMDDMYQRVKACGVQFPCPPEASHVIGLGEIKTAHFRDPDGVLLELVSMPRKAAPGTH